MKIPPINFGSFWSAVYEKLCKIYTSIYQKEYILTIWAPLVSGLGVIAYTRIAITFFLIVLVITWVHITSDAK